MLGCLSMPVLTSMQNALTNTAIAPQSRWHARKPATFALCEDNATFEFILDFSGDNSVFCGWINMIPKKVQTRRSKYCFTDKDGVENISDVGKECTSACGLCEE